MCIPNKPKELKIPFLSSSSGLYVCINLKLYLDPSTLGEDLVFHHCFLYHMLILSHGKTHMCKEPGRFQLIFAEKLPTLCCLRTAKSGAL